MFTTLIQKLSTLSSLYLLTILLVIVSVCYINTLGNGLFFDDEHFIYNNQVVKDFDLTGFFSQSLTSGAGKLSNYYRPLLFLGFGIEYSLFKELGGIYHLDSLLIHFAGGGVLFLLIKKLFSNKLLAFLTSLLFLIHPLQAEAVSYASGRGDPLSFLFVMLTLYWSLSKSRTYQLLSLLALACALLSKEIALVTPGLVFLVHLFNQQKITRATFKKSILSTLPIAAITLVYFVLRVTVLNFANTLNFYNTENIYSSSLFVRLNIFFHLLPTYLSLLVYPKDLFMERDSGITIVTTPTVQSVISFVLVIVVFVLSLWKKKQLPIVLFSFLWIGITFVPTSGIVPINGFFYEHFLFYPSVGFFLLFTYGFLALYQRIPKIGKEMLGILLIAVLLLLCLRTVSRNREWRDPITFYSQTLNHVQSPRAFNNLAMAYADQGNNKQAIVNYKKAIALVDAYPESHYNLANAYLAEGDSLSAEKEYKEALRIDQTFYFSYIRLYQLYTAQKNTPGLTFVRQELTSLGQTNPGFLQLLKQLEQQ